jgi:hypothetical protein
MYTIKEYFESVYMFMFLPLESYTAVVRAIISAFGVHVPGRMTTASITCCPVNTAYTACWPVHKIAAICEQIQV